MNKKSKRILSTIITGTVLLSAISYFSYDNIVKADSYRTNYTIYGDLNKDNVLDVFDIIMLREKINNKKYDKESDLNGDKVLNENDLSLLSNYLLGTDTFFSAFFNDDADEDELCDIAEVKYFNTDPDNSDTDKDNLPDYYEITVSYTDPKNAHSCDSKLNDGDYDSDFDTLSNKEEYSLKTNPLNEDSDYDGLTDDFEISTSKTNPISPDTDEDNVFDGDELKLNLNPNSAMTDGINKDGEIITHQEISSNSDALGNINSNNSDYSLDLEIDAAGYAENSVKVYRSQYRELLKNSAMVGEPIEISYNENLPVESIKVNFNVKQNDSINLNGLKKSGSNSSKYMIFEFFPKNNYMLPVDTVTAERNKISTIATKPGIFCLINMDEYKKVLNDTGIFAKDADGSYSKEKCEIVFFLDLSSNIAGKIDETKTSIRDFCDVLFNTTDNSVVKFEAYYNNSVYTFPTQSSCTDMADVEKLLEFIEPIGESMQSNVLPVLAKAELISSPSLGFFTEDCKNKYIFILSDSNYNHNNSSHGYGIVTEASNYISMLQTIYNNDVDLNFILSSELYNNSYTNKLIKLCDKFGFNVYSKSMLNSFIICTYNDVWGRDSTHVFTITGSLPIDIRGRINRNFFIAGLPRSFDISKLPPSDANGTIKIADGFKGISIMDENDKFIGPKLPSFFEKCDESLTTARGLSQMRSYFDVNEYIQYENLPMTPLLLTPNYSSKEETAMDFQLAFTKLGKDYYYPKTFYPDLYTISGHMEKINGEFDENGNWIDWH